MSVLLITKSYTFLFYSRCYLLQNIYGMCKKNYTLSTAQTSFPWIVLFPVRSFVWTTYRCYLPEVQQTDTSAAHTWASSPLLHETRTAEMHQAEQVGAAQDILIHVHEILLAGVQQSLRAEVTEAEDPVSPSTDTQANRATTALKPPGSPHLLQLLRASAQSQQHQPEPSSHSITLSSIQKSLHQTNLTWETVLKFSLARGTHSCPAPMHKAHKSPLNSSVSLLYFHLNPINISPNRCSHISCF